MDRKVYSNRLVAFIDLLGFSKFVGDSSKDETKAIQILDLISDMSRKSSAEHFGLLIGTGFLLQKKWDCDKNVRLL